jgi:hypothetical protein
MSIEGISAETVDKVRSVILQATNKHRIRCDLHEADHITRALLASGEVVLKRELDAAKSYKNTLKKENDRLRATTVPKEDVEELIDAAKLLMAAKKAKEAFGSEDADYKQMKRDGWYKLSVALSRFTQTDQAKRG